MQSATRRERRQGQARAVARREYALRMSARQVTSFRALFATDGTEVARAALEGRLHNCPIRGVCWRHLLGAFSGACGSWPALLEAHRREFNAQCTKHCIDPSAAADAPEADVSVGPRG